MSARAGFDRVVDRHGSRSVKWGASSEPLARDAILPMSIADIDFLAPPAVVAALERQAALGVYGYAARGDAFYASIARWLDRRHEWRVDRSWICPCPGVVPALHAAIRAVSRPGDGVVVQTPVYYPFFSAVTTNGRTVIESPLRVGRAGWEIDFADLDAALARARVLVLCNPHNPVGRVWRRDELAEIARLCDRHEVTIVSDDIHADIAFSPYTPIARGGGAPARRTITAFSPSKTFGLSSLHTAYCVISEDALRRAFEAETARMGYFWGNVFGDTALEVAYREGEPWLDALLGYLKGNLAYLEDAFRDHPSIRVTAVEGTYLAWLDFRGAGLDEDSVCDLLTRDARVALDRGSLFGAPGAGFQRLNFATPARLLREGIRRIQRALPAGGRAAE